MICLDEDKTEGTFLQRGDRDTKTWKRAKKSSLVYTTA